MHVRHVLLPMQVKALQPFCQTHQHSRVTGRNWASMTQAFPHLYRLGNIAVCVAKDNSGWMLQAWSQARIATAVGEHDVHHV